MICETCKEEIEENILETPTNELQNVIISAGNYYSTPSLQQKWKITKYIACKCSGGVPMQSDSRSEWRGVPTLVQGLEDSVS
jgi:hypothetical protein